MKTKLRNAMVGLAAVGMVAGGATSASAHEGRLVGVNNVSYQSCTWEVAAQVGALRATGHLTYTDVYCAKNGHYSWRYEIIYQH